MEETDGTIFCSRLASPALVLGFPQTDVLTGCVHPSQNGYTALHWALAVGDMTIAELLLDLMARPDIPNQVGAGERRAP